ncbi:MAG: phosphoadenosine phosphosulfate reductase family protein [Clostridia bacterium]
MSTVLIDSIKTASMITDKVLVSFSGGKDSVAVLNLCKKYFKEVQPFFMYYVKGLSFQEKLLQYYEKVLNIKIIRIPHFELSQFMRYGTFRQYDLNIPIITVKETYDYVRELTGIYWIAGGERIDDSIVRRAMIKNSGSIDEKRGRFFPVAYWNKKEVLKYVKHNKLKVSGESEKLGFSFRSLNSKDLIKIKKFYPNDYKKIKEWFPFAEASVKQGELYE